MKNENNIAFSTRRGDLFPIKNISDYDNGQLVEISKNNSSYWIFVPKGRTDFRYCQKRDCSKEIISEGIRALEKPLSMTKESCEPILEQVTVSASNDSSSSYLPAYIQKPKGSESLKKAQEICQTISDEADARGNNTLYIAFEGLSCIDNAGVTATDKYHVDLLRGDSRSSPPKGSGIWPGGGFLLYGQIIPLIQKEKNIEYIVFPWDSIAPGKDSVPEVCAQIWKKSKNGKKRKLVIMGHSLGGHSAAVLSEALSKKGVETDLVVTVDPVLQWRHTPQNYSPIKKWLNYFQTKPGFNKASTKINGAENIYSPKYNHLNMTKAPEIFEALSSELAQ